MKTSSPTRSGTGRVSAGAGGGAELVGALLDDASTSGTVGSGRRPVVEQVDGAAEDDLLGVADGGRGSGCTAPSAGTAAGPGPQARPAGLGGRQPGQAAPSGPASSGLPVQAAADADHLPAELLGGGVVRLGVAQDQHVSPRATAPVISRLPPFGLSGAGLAETRRGWL